MSLKSAAPIYIYMNTTAKHKHFSFFSLLLFTCKIFSFLSAISSQNPNFQFQTLIFNWISAVRSSDHHRHQTVYSQKPPHTHTYICFWTVHNFVIKPYLFLNLNLSPLQFSISSRFIENWSVPDFVSGSCNAFCFTMKLKRRRALEVVQFSSLFIFYLIFI